MARASTTKAPKRKPKKKIYIDAQARNVHIYFRKLRYDNGFAGIRGNLKFPALLHINEIEKMMSDFIFVAEEKIHYYHLKVVGRKTGLHNIYEDFETRELKEYQPAIDFKNTGARNIAEPEPRGFDLLLKKLKARPPRKSSAFHLPTTKTSSFLSKKKSTP